MLGLFLFFFKEMDLDDGRPKFNSDEEEEEKVLWFGIGEKEQGVLRE